LLLFPQFELCLVELFCFDSSPQAELSGLHKHLLFLWNVEEGYLLSSALQPAVVNFTNKYTVHV
jgi:hypothetical protein